MTQITNPLPFRHTILVSDRNQASDRPDTSPLRRMIIRLRDVVRWVDRGDPLATPSRRALDSTDTPDITR